MLLRESVNNIAFKQEVMRLLLLLCSFPVTVAQAATSCIAQCGQKSKELKEEWKGKVEKKMWKREGEENNKKESYLNTLKA